MSIIVMLIFLQVNKVLLIKVSDNLELKLLPTTKRINLTATALTQYNNTEIQCRAVVYGSTSQVLSDYATLLVQGKAIINKLSVNNVLIICSQVYYHQLLMYLIILLIPQVSLSH